MPKCKGCKNSTGRNKVTFYVIPNPHRYEKDKEKFEIMKERADKWLRHLKGGYDTTNFPFSKNQVLCEEHFEAAMFKDDIKARVMGLPCRKLLRDDAYPTIFGNSIGEEEESCLPKRPQSHLTGTELQENSTNSPSTSEELTEHATEHQMNSGSMPPDKRFAQNRKVTDTVDVGLQTGTSFLTEGTVEVATQTISRIFQIRKRIKLKTHRELSCLAMSHSVWHDATVVCKGVQNDHCYLNHEESH